MVFTLAAAVYLYVFMTEYSKSGGTRASSPEEWDELIRVPASVTESTNVEDVDRIPGRKSRAEIEAMLESIERKRRELPTRGDPADTDRAAAPFD